MGLLHLNMFNSSIKNGVVSSFDHSHFLNAFNIVEVVKIKWLIVSEVSVWGTIR